MKKKKFFGIFVSGILIIILAISLAACSVHSDWVVIKEPTCTEEGKKVQYKADGKTIYKEESIPAKTHKFYNWQVITIATETTNGEMQRKCENCDYFESKIVPKVESKLNIAIMDNDNVIKRIYLDESNGEYDLTDLQFEKEGYEFISFVDTNDNTIENLQGKTDESFVVYTNWKVLPTTTFEELQLRANAGVANILIASDIDITETIYIPKQTTITTDGSYTFTRNAGFKNEIFVVGENDKCENALILTGKKSQLTLMPKSGETLTIEGGNIECAGSAILVVNSAKVNMHDGVIIQNFNKTSNEKLLDLEKYLFSYNDRTGGSGVAIVNGEFNMYGGKFFNNISNLVEKIDGDSESDDSDNLTDEDIDTLSESSSTKVNNSSYYGGAVYNYGTFNMYGGIFEQNSSARGGAIYSYRYLRVMGGSFIDNNAASYGGAIYMPNSQYANTFIGIEGVSENVPIFNGNSANKSGGAIYVPTQAALHIYSGKFESNYAKSNGGAINATGATVILDGHFVSNTADNKGGAIYSYYTDIEATRRHTEIKGGLFDNNSAPDGGALTFTSVEEIEVTGSNGSIGYVENATFNNNLATSGNGSAVYISKKSTVTIINSTFNLNQSTNNGGAIYVTALSQLKVEDSFFTQNKAGAEGGAIYLTTAKDILAPSNGEEDKRTKVIISNTKFEQNSTTAAKYGGGAIYLTNSQAILKDIILENNSTNNSGGGIGIYSGSNVEITNIIATLNKAKTNGGAIYLTSENTKITINGDAKFANNTAKNGGAINTAGTNTSFIMNGTSNFDGNSSTAGGGALYLKTGGNSKAIINAATKFSNNTAKGNGGAVHITDGMYVKFNGATTFENNRVTATDKLGGALYIAGGSNVIFEKLSANSNSASAGGMLAMASNGTCVCIKSGNSINNTATLGNVFSGTAGVKVSIYSDFIYDKNDENAINGTFEIEEINSAEVQTA